ncbi:hypothetical protein PG993_012471 [Apiospora rasikravindrae]|uniref:Uncharacterized protein n=1 Tax=Apiospora rasikravindrae TaxID=990691 RepID=A0ABR1S2I7_9PEZI
MHATRLGRGGQVPLLVDGGARRWARRRKGVIEVKLQAALPAGDGIRESKALPTHLLQDPPQRRFPRGVRGDRSLALDSAVVLGRRQRGGPIVVVGIYAAGGCLDAKTVLAPSTCERAVATCLGLVAKLLVVGALGREVLVLGGGGDGGRPARVQGRRPARGVVLVHVVGEVATAAIVVGCVVGLVISSHSAVDIASGGTNGRSVGEHGKCLLQLHVLGGALGFARLEDLAHLGQSCRRDHVGAVSGRGR